MNDDDQKRMQDLRQRLQYDPAGVNESTADALKPYTYSLNDLVEPQAFADQPYYIEKQVPPSAESVHWQTYISGPFVNEIHFGTRQECGPRTVRLLNLAYRAGRRAADAETPVRCETEVSASNTDEKRMDWLEMILPRFVSENRPIHGITFPCSIFSEEVKPKPGFLVRASHSVFNSLNPKSVWTIVVWFGGAKSHSFSCSTLREVVDKAIASLGWNIPESETKEAK